MQNENGNGNVTILNLDQFKNQQSSKDPNKNTNIFLRTFCGHFDVASIKYGSTKETISYKNGVKLNFSYLLCVSDAIIYRKL